PPERDGFVQVRFEVTPQGRAESLSVVGAMPAGYFEDEAIAQIQRKRFVPDRVEGEAVRSVRTEIVEFKYTPAQTRAVPAPANN
ncbi:MAG: TonB family protein, partial [Pseudomonadota bacterium]